MDVETLDGESFLAVNGVQTLSHAYGELSASVQDLLKIGIRRLRLSPHAHVDMIAVADAYRAVANGTMDGEQAHVHLAGMLKGAEMCNGYIRGQNGHIYS